MGRELKRKQAKVEGKNLVEEKIKKNDDPYSDIYKLLKIFGILLVIVVGIHFFTALVITKEIEWFSDWFSKDEEKPVTVVAGSILANTIFDQKEEEYYVYFYDFDEESTDLTYLVNGNLSKEKVYKVNTKDGFNSNYVTEEETGNSSAKSLEDLKVITPTLIKISGDTIVEYYETKDSITTYLESK